MNVTLQITNNAYNVGEAITLEEWDRDHDTYLVMAIGHARYVFLRIVDGEMILKCKDDDGKRHNIVLKRYNNDGTRR